MNFAFSTWIQWQKFSHSVPHCRSGQMPHWAWACM